MTAIKIDGKTIGKAFSEAVERFGSNPFLMAPADTERDYHLSGEEARAYGLIDKVVVHREPEGGQPNGSASNGAASGGGQAK